MRGLSVIIVVVGLALARTAVAEDFSHKGQFGVHVQPGTGYRVLFPYNEEYCGQTDDNGGAKSVCTGRSPFFLDLGVTYSPVPYLALLAEIRLGLERDFEGLAGQEGPRPMGYALGVRYFADDGGKAKFFSSFAGVIETTDYEATAGLSGTDYGVRNVNGLQIDFSNALGFYAHFGLTLGFVNWLRFELHGGIGLQARFP
jgi:hypothetical protein